MMWGIREVWRLWRTMRRLSARKVPATPRERTAIRRMLDSFTDYERWHAVSLADEIVDQVAWILSNDEGARTWAADIPHLWSQ